MQRKWLGFLLSTVAAAALVACGGGSSAPTVTLSGEVIDGYIEGATVCLDSNGDGVCGADEPSAVTDANGAFSLSVAGSTDGKYIVVSVPATAKDSDDGGKTLQEAGKSAYVMATPAATPQVVSPLTTLLVGKIKADGLSLAEARSRVLDELGLPAGTDLHRDHVEAEDLQVHAMARQVAARLQEAKREAGSGGGDLLATIANKLKEQNSTLGEVVVNPPASLANIPSNLAAVADGKLLLYKMVSAKGTQIVASAMLFTPKSSAPDGGWPLIVLGVGTTGIAGQCAPSYIMQGGNGFPYDQFVSLMISREVAVVVPDYEGRGPSQAVPSIPKAHPYLHVGSAGNSMVLAAVAAKRLLGDNLSGAWAAWGHSQGGHAALAAAQFAGLGERLESSLDYRGAVAVAPASHFVESVQGLIGLANGATNTQEAFSHLGTLGFYASYIVKGSSFTAAPMDPDRVLGTEMKAVHAFAGEECLNSYSDRVQGAVTAFAMGGGQPSNFGAVNVANITAPDVRDALRSLEPGRVKLPGKTLLVQGSADTTVLPATTQALTQVMQSKGSDVTLELVQSASATHSGVLGTTQAVNAMVTHLTQVFNSQ
jgi:hypothetical protein